MVMGSLRWVGVGIGIGVGLDRLAMEMRKPEAERYRWLRLQVNENVNPWLLEHHVAGSAKGEIATLEHVGRRTGTIHLTPVHPTIRGDTVYIPAPLGAGSQWAQNVLHAGHARLQLHEQLYDLDRPELIAVADTGFFAPPIDMTFDRMGWRYLRLHVVSTRPGAFPTHRSSLAATFDAEPILDMSADIPLEPKMVDRDSAPA